MQGTGPVDGARWAFRGGPWNEESWEHKALHGDGDSRQNVAQACADGSLDESFRRDVASAARRVACLVPWRHLNFRHDTQRYHFAASVPTLGEKLHQPDHLQIGAKERFVKEHIPGEGTAFLVAKDILLTACHCTFPEGANRPDIRQLTKTYFVFDYQTEVNGAEPSTFGADSVYTFRHLIHYRYVPPDQPYSQDWALIQVDREVTGRKPLPINFNWEAALGDEIYMLGHPWGLPMKYTGTATVEDIQEARPHEVGTNLDAFKGNSGSPILMKRPGDKQSLRAVAMLVRGQHDLQKKFHYGGVQGETRLEPYRERGSIWEIGVRIESLNFLKGFLPSLDAVSIPLNRQFKPGLSIEAPCSACGAELQVVNIGFSEGTEPFNMNKIMGGTVACPSPNCGTIFPWEATNVMVLANCRYRLEGANTDGLRIEVEQALGLRHLFRFDVQEWFFIEVWAYPLDP